ncbi:MAG: LamG domain-containing protein [Actinomycetota bacterium]|nr:LamG domain-containing protein [Actinomycetota bacterium]
MSFKRLGRYVSVGAATIVFAAGLQAPASAVTSTVALWHMDETSGSVMHDSSGHGNDGALHNVALGQLSPHGYAYGFNGKSSYVKVPNSPSLNPGSAGLTITMNLKFTQLPANDADYDLLRKGLAGTAGGDFKIEIRDNGMAFCRFRGSSGAATLRKGPHLQDGNWHTLQCVKTDTTIQLVIDGVTYSKAAVVGSISNSSDVIVGAKPGDDFYNGLLDEVVVAVG